MWVCKKFMGRVPTFDHTPRCVIHGHLVVVEGREETLVPPCALSVVPFNVCMHMCYICVTHVLHMCYMCVTYVLHMCYIYVLHMCVTYVLHVCYMCRDQL